MIRQSGDRFAEKIMRLDEEHDPAKWGRLAEKIMRLKNLQSRIASSEASLLAWQGAIVAGLERPGKAPRTGTGVGAAGSTP
jgi:hypothetical protein